LVGVPGPADVAAGAAYGSASEEEPEDGATSRSGGGSGGGGSSAIASLAASFGHPHLAGAITGASTAAVVTIAGVDFAYAAKGDLPWLGLAIALGLLVFAALALFWIQQFNRLVKAGQVNNNELQKIRNRVVEEESTLATSPRHEPGTTDEEAKSLTRRRLDELKSDLGASSGFWADGTAYLEAWARLHRAEEEAVMCARLFHVRSVAIRDLDRLRGSTIPHAGDLQVRLREALDDVEAAIRQDNQDGSASDAMARADVRYVLNTINEFREGQWRALVDFRDVVTTTAALLWVTIYGTLLVAIAAGASAMPLTGALMFFLAGAIAGFLAQMYSQSRSGSESSVEDFGLALARIFAMPAFSGAIALVGVVSVAALHLNVNGLSLSPVSGSGAAVDWNSVFNWQTNGLGFGVAFVVALAPESLFDLLKNSKDIKMAISRSEASG